MPSCEKCWRDAGGNTELYHKIVAEREFANEVCTPKEQAGQWWDEKLQRDSRLLTGDQSP